MSQREDLVKFETDRIKALQEERLHIQKKTFTKWMNSFLSKARMEVDDLFTDLSDGKKLLKLLEIISGEKLGKPNDGRMRVHKIENVNKSLAFLHTKVRLESIGAEDIVDGNPRLILGLIWTIILRFQIQEIEIEVDEDNESSEKKSAKEALLLWCQRRTNGYQHVRIDNFSGSWRSGMGFNALIHFHRPDLINYSSLNPENHIENLNYAFEVAQRDLGVSKLLDAEDVDTERPDEKSIMTYVSSFYHTFAKLKHERKGGRRIANIIAQLMEIESLQRHYENYTSNLLSWIQSQITKLSDTNLPNSLDGIQKEMTRFKDYRTVEKPPKYTERSEIEALLFGIQTQNKALGQPLYSPPEGKLVHDIGRAWTGLEKAEHKREVAIREEFLRLERLESLAFRFERKSVLREGYLKEMIQVLSDPRYGSNLAQVEATVKKHEAISADIIARTERFESLDSMAQELIDGNYHGKERVIRQKDEIGKRWKQLLALLEQHKLALETASSLMSSIREADTISEEIKEMEKTLSTSDSLEAQHLSAVEDLLQKQSLIESQIVSSGETIQKLNKQSKLFLNDNNNLAVCKEVPLLQKRLDKLNAEYTGLIDLAKTRRAKLEEMRIYYQFVEDHEEAEAWVVERQRICQAVLPSKDLLGVGSFQQKHKALEAEIRAHKGRINRVSEAGEALILSRHPQKANIRSRIDTLQKQWDYLHEVAVLKRKQLEDAVEAFQYHHDANEAESWMKEKMQLVTIEDYGKDDISAAALLLRHSHLESEIKAYGTDIKRLNDQSEEMIRSGIASLFMICGDAFSASTQAQTAIESEDAVPVEEWVEEKVERSVLEEAIEEVRIPQVLILYNFRSQNGLEVSKGDIVQLNERTNNDWWSVKKSTLKGPKDGFVPANYVRQVDDKVARIAVKRPKVVVEIQRVKRVVMKKSKKPNRRSKRRLSIICDSESVEQRQRNISSAYDELFELCKNRRQMLEDAIQLYRFNRECDNFESWINDREISMIDTHKQYQEQMQSNQKAAIPITDHVELLRKKFDNFVTELAANKSRMEEIDRMVAEFTSGRQQHYSQAIKQRQKQIFEKWDTLNRVREEMGKNVEGLTSVDLFNRTCDDALEWMGEKREKMEYGEVSTRDMKSIQALQRRHDNTERELAPIEEKLNRVNLLAETVKTSFPTEVAHVTVRQRQLKEMWEGVTEEAVVKRKVLDESLGFQFMKTSALDLLGWIRGYARQSLASSDANSVRDVATAEVYLKSHEDLGYEIAAKEDDFKDIQDLGYKLLKLKPNPEIEQLITDLKSEKDSLYRAWQEKDNWLKQCKDLMIFNQEVDHLETMTNSHNTYLEFETVGATLDEAEGLLKRHENFLATLAAQDERMQGFSEMADKLIKAGHYNAANVDEKRRQVILKRQSVKEKATERKKVLFDSLAYQQFKAEADEFMGWCSAKMKTANDESYRDLLNVERKLQKHEVFEAEINASQSRFAAIVGKGEHLLSIKHLDSENIVQVLKSLDSKWKELCSKTVERGKGLRQAYAQLNFNRDLENAESKYTEIQRSLMSTMLGKDLRGCKELIKKHQILEMDLTNWKVKVAELNQYAEGLSATHFDGPNMLKSSKEVAEKFSGLDEPCLKRRIKLNESLKFHQFEFDVNAEIHWFQDREQVISSADVAQDLVEAQNLIKKHQKLSREVAGHQSQIEKTVAGGEILVTQDHFAKGAIAFKSKELTDKWKALKEMVLEKRKRLEQSLKIQTFLSEVNEVESWIGDKVNFFKNSDYGKNEDAAVKLLTKHKADELEVDTYFGLVNEMKMAAHKLASSKPPEEAVITDRTKELEMHLKELEQLLVQRKAKIIDSKHFHEYIRETDNFLNWIAEKMQTATSDDYGSDYEHLLLLQSKFRDFKHHIESNADRFGQSEQFAGKLKKTDLAQEVKLRQSEVKEAWENLLDVIAARNKKLNAAGEIHRFNRDVAEALCRIQEKYSILSTEDLGRDLHSVQSLLRKHEGYENDLVALEAQLQSLIDDSARLQSAYPGGNADHILQQQEIVVQHWNTLQERAALRKDHLLASFALQKFIAVVKDLERWADTLGTEIGTQERVRDAASAQALKTEHDRIKAEIETREPDFNAVVKSGEAMINEDHIAGEEIRSHMTRMLQCREALHTAWQLKKVYLDQLNDLHCFLRDAKQLDQLSNQQEHFLTSTELGSTVEQVLSNIKKQEAFEKLLSSQDEKLISLQQSGIKLLQQNHFDSETIRKRMDEITSRRARVKEMSLVRKQDLDRAKQVLSYQRRADETVSWILEKDAGAHLDESSITEDLDAIQFMIRAHNSFERNLGAVREQVEILTKEAQRLISLFSEVRDEIEAKNNTVTEMWHSLLMKSARKRHRLEQAESWQAYYNEYKKLICWIKELFQAIVLEDLAIADVESAEIQLVRHKERKIELDNRTETCDQFRAVGEGLLSKGHMMAEEIKTKLDDFIRSLNELHTTWRNRKSVYEQNVDARKFQRDADMLDDWIEESLDTLNDKNLGDSISRAEELIKKHEEFERRILAQEDKFSALKRITLIENTFKRQQEAEEEMIRSEYARQEQEKRLLEEQSKEDERRRNADASKPNDGHGYGFVRSLIGSKHQKPQENGFKLPPVEIEGTLDRKQEHLSGGKRAPNRSWKVYYTVLCGQLLCFFKDKLAFMANVAAAPPVNILGAKCSKASDYTKKKHVFRLLLTDNSEFLFAANEEGIIQEWLNKMSFHANLPPSMQLTSYESAKEQLPNSSPTSQNSHPDQREHRGEVSSQTSSSPDITREHSKSELNLGGSKRPPPLPQALPPSVMSRSSVHIPVNGSASQNGARGPPPLPPPRTITMASEFPSHPIQQQVTLRGHENGSDRRPITEADLYEMQRQEINVSNGVNGRSASFRNTMPAARQVVHTNGSEYANEQVHVVRSSHSFIMPAAPPQYVPSAHVHGAPVRPVYDHPRHPASIRNIDQRFEMNSDEEWSEKRTEFRYAQTTTQQQVMVARHMSLPPNAPRPNQFVGQGMQTQAMGMRPQSAASSTSEDDIPVHKAVTKKKGVMSLFKRNK